MHIPKVKKPNIPNYKGVKDQSKFIDWICRKEGILIDIVEEQKTKKAVEELMASQPVVYTTKTLTDQEIKDEDIKLSIKK